MSTKNWKRKEPESMSLSVEELRALRQRFVIYLSRLDFRIREAENEVNLLEELRKK